MFNRFVGVGNLTRDPEVRYTPSGVAVATVPIAINTRFRSNGETKDETLFIDVIVFNKQAEVCMQYLKKGRQVLIEGRLRERKWEKDGVTHRRMEVVANTVRFLSPRDSSLETDAAELESLANDVVDSGEPF